MGLDLGKLAKFALEAVEKLEGAIDTFEATEIRGTATPQDFSLAEDDDFVAHTEDTATDDSTTDGSTTDDSTADDSTTGDTTPDTTAPDPAASTSSTTTSTAPGGSTETTETAATGRRSARLPHTL